MIFLRVLEGPLLHENIGWTHPVYNFNCYQFILFLDNFYWHVVDLQCASFKCTAKWISYQFSSVQFSCSVMSNSLRPHGLWHARLPCSSPTPKACSNLCPSSQWCYTTVSSSVIPFSSCPQSLPASGSFSMSQLFAWGSQSIGVSALISVLPMNTQHWSPLEWNGWISLQSKGLSGVFSNTTIQKHQFFSAQLSSQSNSHIPTWLLEKP